MERPRTDLVCPENRLKNQPLAAALCSALHTCCRRALVKRRRLRAPRTRQTQHLKAFSRAAHRAAQAATMDDSSDDDLEIGPQKSAEELLRERERLAEANGDVVDVGADDADAAMPSPVAVKPEAVKPERKPHLAYGDKGAPPLIPPGASLLFNLELISLRDGPPPEPHALAWTNDEMRPPTPPRSRPPPSVSSAGSPACNGGTIWKGRSTSSVWAAGRAPGARRFDISSGH